VTSHPSPCPSVGASPIRDGGVPLQLSCMIYCLLYIVSCMSKHSPDFYVLLFGRLTGGMATSILFSSFESWYASAFRIRI